MKTVQVSGLLYLSKQAILKALRDLSARGHLSQKKSAHYLQAFGPDVSNKMSRNY